jgi:GT2 family glycosyltransferase
MRNSNPKTRFRLPHGYASRDTPDYFNDVDNIYSDKTWQPEVYELAQTILLNRECDKIVDIGCGSGKKLSQISCKTRVGIDIGSNIDFCRNNYDWGTWIEADLESIGSDFLDQFCGNATVFVCADVIEHLCNPVPLVALWRSVVDRGSMLITSTPDRALNRGNDHKGPPGNPAHVREWVLDEYISFLADQGVPPSAAGLTIDNDVDRQLKTIVTFHDGLLHSKNKVTIKFDELRYWLIGLRCAGNLLVDYKRKNACSLMESEMSSSSKILGIDGSSPDYLGGPSIVSGSSAPARAVDVSALDRMILIASELAASQVKCAAQERELRAVRDELGERDAKLTAVVADQAASTALVAQLRDELGERDAKLTAVVADQAASTALVAQLRDELGAATNRGHVTADVLREDLIVCMLFFNKVEQTIESAESFVRAGIAVHLLDNGSTPEAAARLRAHFETCTLVTILDAGSNKGVSGGRNQQILQTTQSWLVFVDNDITLDSPNMVSEFAKSLNKNPESEIFVPRLFNKHDDSWSHFSDFLVDDNGNCAFVEAGPVFSNSFPGGASIVSRSVFDRIGLYDEDLFVGFEDFELAIRAWKLGRPLLAARLDGVVFIHDHRVSALDADKSTARIRYDVQRITHSHSVIQSKHGVLLDPNFSDWLDEQVRQLTGDECVKSTNQAPRTEHALRGATTRPRWCGGGRISVLVNGDGTDDVGIWMQLRAAHLAAEEARKNGLDVRLFLVGGKTELSRRALAANITVDEPSLVQGQTDIFVQNCKHDLGFCWLSRGLLTPGFLIAAAQCLKFDRSMERAFIHPERIIFADDENEGFQYVRNGWFDPLDDAHDARLYPVFVASCRYLQQILEGCERTMSVPDQMMMLIARNSGRTDRHFGLTGSATLIRQRD